MIVGERGVATHTHASMTKLGVFTSCHFNSIEKKNCAKFRNLTIAKVHFLLKIIFHHYFLCLFKIRQIGYYFNLQSVVYQLDNSSLMLR